MVNSDKGSVALGQISRVCPTQVSRIIVVLSAGYYFE